MKKASSTYRAVPFILCLTGMAVRGAVTNGVAGLGDEPGAALNWRLPSFVSSAEVLAETRDRLVKAFDTQLANPDGYRTCVERECGLFPEGDLFPYIYPALAYVNVALRDPARRPHSAVQAAKLIDVAVMSAARRVRPPRGRLEELTDYKRHATYLGQLNLALGAYALIGDDGRYTALRNRLSYVLHRAMVRGGGRPLVSFPEYAWPFDTIAVLLSLQLYDAKTGIARSGPIIRQHLAWVREHATHPELRLPYSRIDEAAGQGKAWPRGCDLSFRLCLLPHLDKAYARDLYREYVRSFWLEKGVLAGFAEWPNGVTRRQDADSGPIVMGVGLAATGLGLGAAIAAGDQDRVDRLCGQLASIDLIRPLFVAAYQQMAPRDGGAVPLDDGYVTGFLFGDAMLFYCVTWQPWPVGKAGNP
ncbi:MAG: hypothetical protein JXR37_15040 [Kiritimatiellae bacterium]|nr:hypothetical protein [Kiritimatiellia bacterium]